MLVFPHFGVRQRNILPVKHFAHTGIDAAVDDELIGCTGLFEMREMRALNPLLPHPDEAGIKGDVEAGGAGAKNDHPAAFGDKCGDRKSLLAGMFKNNIHILFAGNIPDGFTEFTGFAHEGGEFGRIDFGQLAPAVEILAVDDTLGPKTQHIIALGFIRNHTDCIGSRRCA